MGGGDRFISQQLSGVGAWKWRSLYHFIYQFLIAYGSTVNRERLGAARSTIIRLMVLEIAVLYCFS